MVPVLARAAAAIFMEYHPDPAKAMSDGPNSWPLHKVSALIKQLMEIDGVVKSQPRLEDELGAC